MGPLEYFQRPSTPTDSAVKIIHENIGYSHYWMYVGVRPALCEERNNVPTPCVHVTVLTGRSTAYILTFISFRPSKWTSLYYYRVLEITLFSFHTACGTCLIFSLADIFASDFNKTLNGTRPRTSSAVGGRICFFLWLNVPGLRSFFLRGKPWWQFESGAAEHPEERWVPPINRTSSRFYNGYRRISNTQFRWRLSVVIFHGTNLAIQRRRWSFVRRVLGRGGLAVVASGRC